MVLAWMVWEAELELERLFKGGRTRCRSDIRVCKSRQKLEGDTRWCLLELRTNGEGCAEVVCGTWKAVVGCLG